MQITRTRGDTVADSFTVTNPATGSIVNLTSCSLKLTVSTVPNPTDSTTQLFQLQGVIDDPTNGIVEFYPTSAQADNVGYFYYDIEMTDSYGRILTLVKDTYVFTQDITK
jgi:hypothetical protein